MSGVHPSTKKDNNKVVSCFSVDNRSSVCWTNDSSLCWNTVDCKNDTWNVLTHVSREPVVRHLQNNGLRRLMYWTELIDFLTTTFWHVLAPALNLCRRPVTELTKAVYYGSRLTLRSAYAPVTSINSCNFLSESTFILSNSFSTIEAFSVGSWY